MKNNRKICYVATVPITIRWFFIEQLQYLARYGYDVTVICSCDDEIEKELGSSVRYIRVDIPRGISLLGSLKTIISLLKIFNKEKFLFIQYSTINASLYSSIAAFIARTPIRNFHLMGARYKGYTGPLRSIFFTLEKLTVILSTHVECVSQSNLEEGIMDKLFKANKAVVVWNGSTGGVNLNRFNLEQKQLHRETMRNYYNIDEDTVVYAYIGRINVDKGINELIAAYKKMVTENIGLKTKLIIAGYMEEEHLLDQKLIFWAKNTNSVMILSNTKEVEKYFAFIDVLVLPTYREGFGNVIIETGAMGVPVIASRVPGPLDAMVDKQTGLFVEKKNIDDLTDKMLTLSEKELRDKLGRNGVSFVKSKFDSKKLCEHILKRKQELLEGLND